MKIFDPLYTISLQAVQIANYTHYLSLLKNPSCSSFLGMGYKSLCLWEICCLLFLCYLRQAINLSSSLKQDIKLRLESAVNFVKCKCKLEFRVFWILGNS